LGYSLAIDNRQQAHVYGEFLHEATIAGHLFTPRGESDAFVARLRATKASDWAMSLGGDYSRDFPSDIAVDGLGNLYLTGTLSDSTLLAKYSPQGQLLWRHKPAPYNTILGYSPLVDAWGNVYLTGMYFRSARFGATTLTNEGGSHNVFLTKFDPAGRVLWAQQSSQSGGESSWDFCRGLAAGPAGELYMAGNSGAREFSFGGIKQHNQGEYYDNFLVQLREPSSAPLSMNLGADTSLCLGEELVLKPTRGFAHYQWQDGSTDSSLTVSKAGTYAVKVTSFSGQQHSDTVRVFDCQTVFIPNVFTPNGDEHNQVFEVKNLRSSHSIGLSIYDHWGKEVYYTTDYRNDWEASGLSNGVYYYVLTDSAVSKKYRGWVQVLR
jgi:gliding motility-associated-like protein